MLTWAQSRLCLLILSTLGVCSAALLSDPAEVIHAEVGRMLNSEKGRVVFSDIYNSGAFSQEEKRYAGQLYEAFFAVPRTLKTVWESERAIPTIEALSQEFKLSKAAMALLLRIMASEPRMPRILSLKANGEISVLHLTNLEKFLGQSVGRVKVTDWVSSPFPRFDLNSFSGPGDVDWAGKNVVAWLWATRCPVCQRLAPTMVDLDRRFSGSNLAVIGFNVDKVMGLSPDDRERREYAAEQGMQFANYLLDADSWERLGNVNIVPSIFLVDKDGRVERLLINLTDAAALEEAVRELLASPSPKDQGSKPQGSDASP